ncbi:MAG: hypothetical protein ACFFD4_04540 [Candidatus Odinarchaeota archaeon]
MNSGDPANHDPLALAGNKIDLRGKTPACVQEIEGKKLAGKIQQKLDVPVLFLKRVL